MFVHAAFRPLWPVIFFLPLFFVGVAYLLEAVLHLRSWIGPMRTQRLLATSSRRLRS